MDSTLSKRGGFPTVSGMADDKRFRNLTVVGHPLLEVRLTRLRDEATPQEDFNWNLGQVARFLAVEASRLVATKPCEVRTPMESAQGRAFDESIVIVPVLRAGLGMMEPFREVLPEAAVGFIGMARDEETLQPVTYLNKQPPGIAEAHTFLIDPMLATGHSAAGALDLLRQSGAKRLAMVCCFAAPEGVAHLEETHPDVPVITAALDRELNSRGYILPGLGDAGDRQFGT